MSSTNDPSAVRATTGQTRVLILGGSSEATTLVAALAGHAGIDATLSLAGRTATPATASIRVRSGGFGGVDGLVSHLHAEAVDVLVDATHPFAAQMSRHARVAAARAGVRLIDVTRPAWVARPGDRWTEVPTMAQAADALGPTPRHVFLTVGRLQLAAFSAAPHHRYLVRTIDPVGPDHGLPDVAFVTGRGPFDADEERRLMQDHAVEILVTKNSGGAAASAKLAAARQLGLPVVLVARPASHGSGLGVDEAVTIILAHRGGVPRGV